MKQRKSFIFLFFDQFDCTFVKKDIYYTLDQNKQYKWTYTEDWYGVNINLLFLLQCIIIRLAGGSKLVTVAMIRINIRVKFVNRINSKVSRHDGLQGIDTIYKRRGKKFQYYLFFPTSKNQIKCSRLRFKSTKNIFVKDSYNKTTSTSWVEWPRSIQSRLKKGTSRHTFLVELEPSTRV